MNENIKTVAKIGAKSTLKWIGILAMGIGITLLLFTLVLVQNHKFFELATTNPAGFALLIGAPIFIFLYFVIANKYTIQNIIYSVWVSKGQDFVEPLVEKISTKITAKVNWSSAISNQAMLKARLISENATAVETPKLQRKVLNYAFKKVQLDDIDFKDENLRLTDVLILKIKSFISTVSKPSLTLFWIVASIQIVLFVVSQFYTK